MKGDISTDTLVFITISVIVLAIVVYLMFFYSKGSSFECHLCASKFTEWCQKCATTGRNWNKDTWTEDVTKSEDLKKCIPNCLKEISPGNDCNTLKNKCREYVAINIT